ncbi:MAG: carboxypeptidase regulatory-like domain-containing protein [Planctomycetes bacterium]|nr:carboxypeptidase regulatory-like domain-containing protein [Planctomycetota bacterium]
MTHLILAWALLNAATPEPAHRVVVTGTVVDSREKPVSNAQVLLLWQQDDPRAQWSQQHCQSGAGGRFTFPDIPASRSVLIFAYTDEQAASEPIVVSVKGQRTKTVTVKLKAEAATPLRVRVLGKKDQPVVGASVRLAVSLPDPRTDRAIPIDPPSLSVVLTGNGDGWYRTPTKVPGALLYSLFVSADGYATCRMLNRRIPKQGDSAALEPIRLRPWRTLVGKVVDGQGRPVGDARVWTHGCAEPKRFAIAPFVVGQTDANGCFRLEKVHPEACLVFAKTKDRRWAGQAVEPDEAAIQLTLLPRGAASAGGDSSPVLRPVQRASKQRHRWAAQVLRPVVERAEAAKNERLLYQLLPKLAQYAPELALDHLDRISESWLRIQVLTALGEFDEAWELARSSWNPRDRFVHYQKVFESCQDAQKRRQMLTDALADVRGTIIPAFRVAASGYIAVQLYRMGEREAALRLVNEQRKGAEQLAGGLFADEARYYFSPGLALVDAEAALRMAASVNERLRARAYMDLAAQLADLRPEVAERAWQELAARFGWISACWNAMPVCHKMARVDLDRARRIADRLQNLPDIPAEYALAKMAQAYGVMAQAVAKSDPATARRLLQVAFERVEAAQRAQRPPQPGKSRLWILNGHVFAVGASLVESAVVVDPARSREYFWRALALHRGPDAPSRGTIPDQQIREQRNLTQIAILLGLDSTISFPNCGSESSSRSSQKPPPGSRRPPAGFIQFFWRPWP